MSWNAFGFLFSESFYLALVPLANRSSSPPHPSKILRRVNTGDDRASHFLFPRERFFFNEVDRLNYLSPILEPRGLPRPCTFSSFSPVLEEGEARIPLIPCD